ncbi:hypothetical protein PILCRDRAFT_12636 [Piloderma croceum F 1598]|uniref:DUF6533 domain-containing protein n=1 Tax=Piloderma croceum (strain F 1598) TaxID=765440 RepID=A0A0C3BGW8_PILCF|nr:hypothetical protein PILCRDRAFT_12636 [Piloderma croceum F 1598]
MSSTNGHVPLDSNAPLTFIAVAKNNYVNVSFIMLVLYDHVITLDMEIKWIWTLRWGLPKIIFLINRYLLTSFILLGVITLTIYPVSPSVSIFHATNDGSPPEHASQLLTVVLWYEFLPGCFISSDESFIEWRVWVPTLSLEGILMLLMAWRIISYRNEMSHTITVVARDSAFYFVIMLVGIVLTVADQIHTFIPVAPLLPTQCITSIAVGRMMMNLRGLILDDPEHTVHLKTLEFTHRHGLSSEEQEVA